MDLADTKKEKQGTFYNNGLLEYKFIDKFLDKQDASFLSDMFSDIAKSPIPEKWADGPIMDEIVVDYKDIVDLISKDIYRLGKGLNVMVRKNCSWKARRESGWENVSSQKGDWIIGVIGETKSYTEINE